MLIAGRFKTEQKGRFAKPCTMRHYALRKDEASQDRALQYSKFSVLDNLLDGAVSGTFTLIDLFKTSLGIIFPSEISIRVYLARRWPYCTSI
jgi:hypothetical protein